MPQTSKVLRETGEFWFWVSIGSSVVIAEITINVLARFLSAKAWERIGKFLILWLLILIGFVVMLRFF